MPDTDDTQPTIKTSDAEQSYARIKATLANVDLSDASMRGVSVPLVLKRLTKLAPQYAALKPTLATYFKVEIMDPYTQAVAELPDLLAAFFYTDIMANAADVLYPSDDTFALKIEQIKADRAAGMASLVLMEGLGLVSAEHAAYIRSGSGYLDMAKDCVLLGELATTHWAELAPMQAVQRDDARRLTPERVTRLKDNGAQLLKQLTARAGQQEHARVDWERQRLALRTLIERHWSAIRHPVSFHFDQINSPADARPYSHTLGGIR